jgi:hypothetical protein
MPEYVSLQNASPDVVADLLKLDPTQRRLFSLLQERYELSRTLRDVQQRIDQLTKELTDDPA